MHEAIQDNTLCGKVFGRYGFGERDVIEQVIFDFDLAIINTIHFASGLNRSHIYFFFYFKIRLGSKWVRSNCGIFVLGSIFLFGLCLYSVYRFDMVPTCWFCI